MSNHRKPTREAILAARKLPSREVFVPEWDVTVWVRVMTGTERDEYEVDIMKNQDTSLRNMRARLVVRCLVDDAGKLLFSPGDADELGKDSWLPLERIANIAQDVNKMTDRSMEELAGNSVPSLGEKQSLPSP